MEYFREAINSTKGRKGKSKPPLGGVYKDVENPGPQGKLGFLDFPPVTKIDGVNFGEIQICNEFEASEIIINHPVAERIQRIVGYRSMKKRSPLPLARQEKNNLSWKLSMECKISVINGIALHLTDGQNNNEVMSTPFTMHKEGAPDISSLIKKVSLKQVLFGEDELAGV
ncbi:hypothetical protein YC2023_051603 [Brassica napus]